MLDPKIIRSDADLIAKALRKKKFELDVARLAELDCQRKVLQTDTEAFAERKKSALQVYRQGKGCWRRCFRDSAIDGRHQIRARHQERTIKISCRKNWATTFLQCPMCLRNPYLRVPMRVIIKRSLAGERPRLSTSPLRTTQNWARPSSRD